MSGSLIFSAFCLLAALGLTGCGNAKSEAPAGVGDVEVVLAGTVRSAETDEPLEGLSVALIRETAVPREYEVVRDLGETRADGTFGPSAAETIQPEDVRYFLRVTDADENYEDNAATVVFAIVNSDLHFDDLHMRPRDVRPRTVFVGTVQNARTDTPLAGVEIALQRRGEATPAYTTTSDAQGRYSIDDVVLGAFKIVYTGDSVVDADAPEGYVGEDETVTLDETPIYDNEITRLMPKAENDDLSILLDWDYESPEDAPFFQPFDLDATISMQSMGDGTTVVNHLFGRSVDLGSLADPDPTVDGALMAQDFSVSPASGFGAGTSYWPGFLGGDDAGRVTLSASFPVVMAGARPLAELQRTSTDGTSPETMTMAQIQPYPTPPTGLAYNYLYGDDEAPNRHFPTGVAAFTVQLNTDASVRAGEADTRPLGDDIFRSEAAVKVYVGTHFIGRFDIGTTVIPPGEQNKRSWTPFLVEYGFTDANPTRDDQVYFRVVPLSAGKQRVERRRWMLEDTTATAAGIKVPEAYLVTGERLNVAGRVTDALAERPLAEGGGGPFGLFFLVRPPGFTAPLWLRSRTDTVPPARRFNSLGALDAQVFFSTTEAGVDQFSATGGEPVDCPAVHQMRAVQGELLLATDRGLRSAVDCAALDRPLLGGAPATPATLATALHRFADGPRMVLGTDGAGLYTSPLPHPPLVPTAQWTRGAPGGDTLISAGGRELPAHAPPADARVTALADLDGTLLVGSADGLGLFASQRLTDGAPEDSASDGGQVVDWWRPLNAGAPGVSAGEGFPTQLPGPDGGAPTPVTIRDITPYRGHVLISTDHGLIDWNPASGRDAGTFEVVQPAIGVNGAAVLGSTVYVLTEAGMATYR